MAFSILQVNTYDIAGGAERVAWDLHHCFLRRGHASWLAVGKKRSQEQHVSEIPHCACYNPWTRQLCRARALLERRFQGVRGIGRVQAMLSWLADPLRQMRISTGREDFDFPGTGALLTVPPFRPDILHCHNLHGGYFDLRALPALCRQVPVILTLHDAWMLSGHCAHSFSCERWRTGCGACPGLSLFPGIRRDATAFNWELKRRIFRECRFYCATPSHWLMRKVRDSMLAPAMRAWTVIPNGVDLSVFHPGEKGRARDMLGIPSSIRMLLVVGHAARRNPWKDFPTLERALRLVKTDRDLWLICLGEEGEGYTIGDVPVYCKGYEADSTRVADYYRAADIYVHPARADTFPITILEALACGTPVIAAAVGGIPEQVRGLAGDDRAGALPGAGERRHPLGEATGVLTPPGDERAMASWITRLLGEEETCTFLGRNAAKDSRRRFDLEQQADLYLKWYEQALADFSRSGSSPGE